MTGKRLDSPGAKDVVYRPRIVMPSEPRIPRRFLRRALALIALWALCSSEGVSAKMPAFFLEGKPIKESAEVVENKAGDLLQPAPYETRAGRDMFTAYGTWRGLDGTIAIEKATKADRADWPRRAAAADARPLFDGWNRATDTYLLFLWRRFAWRR